MTADSNPAGFRHFHDQLSSLKETLLSMSSKAEERTDIAVEALMNRDREKATLVIDGDPELNRLEIEVEQAAVELLALQQPMARDLRFIIGAIKVSNDLERVGDHAVNIAESALRLADKPKVSIRIPEIEVMARRAVGVISEFGVIGMRVALQGLLLVAQVFDFEHRVAHLNIKLLVAVFL